MITAVGSHTGTVVGGELMQFHEITRHSSTAHAPNIPAGEFPSGIP